MSTSLPIRADGKVHAYRYAYRRWPIGLTGQSLKAANCAVNRYAQPVYALLARFPGLSGDMHRHNGGGNAA
jgi:hypothetical protein